MAWTLDFLDTFTHHPVTTSGVTLYGKWSSLNGTSAPVTIAEDGLQGIKPQDLRRVLLGSTSGRIVGCRVFPTLFVNGSSTLLALFGGASFWITYDELSTEITLNRPAGGPITSALITLPSLQGANLELAAWCDGADAHYEVRVDGVQIADLTGSVPLVSSPTLDTISPSFGGGSGVSFSTYAWVWSKKYSGSGGMWSASDFLGNVRRGVQYADADGLFDAQEVGANWQPNSGSDFFSRLNETLIDGDTTQISTTADPDDSPTNADRASWTLEDSAADIATIKAVQRCTTIRAPSGTNDVKLFTRVDTDADPANIALDAEFSVSSGWSIKQTIYAVDPRDSVSWSKSKLDSLELGIETQDLVA